MEVNAELLHALMEDMKALKQEVKMLREKTQANEEEITNLKSCSTIKLEKSIDVRISNLMLDLGIPKHLKGSMYLHEAVKSVYENIGLIGNVFRVVYPEIASKYETSVSCVERAIRNAIDVSWERGNLELKQKMFSNTMAQTQPKPTNNMLIMTMTDYLRQQSYRQQQLKANA